MSDHSLQFLRRHLPRITQINLVVHSLIRYIKCISLLFACQILLPGKISTGLSGVWVRETYTDKYGETPIQFAADAYDAIYAIKLAAEKENVTPDMSVSDICEAMKKGMTEISLEGLTGTITWTASGEPDKEPKAVKIENGAYTAME